MAQEKCSLTAVEQLMEQGRTHLINANAQAIDYFKRVIELQKDHQEAHACLVLCCYTLYGITKKPDDETCCLSNTHYEQITDGTILTLFMVFFETSVTRESITDINNQLAKLDGMKIEEDLKQENPVDIKLLLKLGILYCKACLHIDVSQPTKALAILEKIQCLYPPIFGKQLPQLIEKSRLDILAEQKSWRDLLAHLKNLIQPKPGHQFRMIDAISTFENMLRVPEALAIIEEEFLPALKNDNNPAFSLFWFHYLQNNWLEANCDKDSHRERFNSLCQKTLPILEQVIALYPECFKFYALKARILIMQDNYDEAQLFFKKAVRLSGNISQQQFNRYVPNRLHDLLAECLLYIKIKNEKGFNELNLYDHAYLWLINKNHKEKQPPEHLKEMIDKLRPINALRTQRNRVWESATTPYERLHCSEYTLAINYHLQKLGFPEYQEKLTQPASLFALSLFSIKQHNISTDNLCDDMKATISRFY